MTRSVVVAVVFVASVSAGAQDPRAGLKLDAPTQVALRAVLDSARAQGLPLAPLWDKVYEGAGKGADGARIVAAVRMLAADMAIVHRALGAVATTDEIKAGASAMHAGVPVVELGKLKKQSGLRRLTTPFTVLADLIARGVPVGTAAKAIRSLVGAGAKDKDINDFRRNVEDDIQQGAPPAAAAETRAKTAAKPDTKPEQQEQEP